MRTLLTVTQDRDKVLASLVSAKTESERNKFLAKFETLSLELATLQSKVAAKSKRMEEEEEEEESSEEEEESEEEEDEDEDKDDDDDDDKDDDDSKSGTDSEEDEEEESKALAKLSSKTGLHTYDRLYRLAKQVTGQKNVAGVFGALDALGTRIKHTAKLEHRVASLEGTNRSTKVRTLLNKAKEDGRITPGQMQALFDQGKKDYKWLKGYLATLPKQVHGIEDGAFPPIGANGEALPNLMPDGDNAGAALSTQGLTADQIKMMQISAEASGESFEEHAKKLQATISRKKTNGTAARF